MDFTPARLKLLYNESERSHSDSTTLLASIQPGYGSLGVYHTPPPPGFGADHTPHTTNTDTTTSLNGYAEEFVVRSVSPPQVQEYATLPVPFTRRNHNMYTHKQAIPAAIAMTPQHSASSASSCSGSPSHSNTDLHCRYPRHAILVDPSPYHYPYGDHSQQQPPQQNAQIDPDENQPYQYRHPYFNSVHHPLYNENNSNNNNNNKAGLVQSGKSKPLGFRSPFDVYYSPTNENAYQAHSAHFHYTNTHYASKSEVSETSKSCCCPNLLPIMNILNAAIGLAHGGWTAIIGFLIISIISYRCSRIYVKIFTRHIESFSYPSYPQLGWIISGSWSYWAILVFSVCECVGIACVYIIFFWNNVYYIICRLELYGIHGFLGPTHNETDNGYTFSLEAMSTSDEIMVFAICIVIILPSLLIIKISNMQYCSYMILCSVLLLAFTLITFIVLHIISHEELAHRSLEHFTPLIPGDHTDGNESYWVTNFASYSISMGIFLFCFSSASYSQLPSIKNSMNEPLLFTKILRYSFILLFILYCSIGIFGYLLFGKYVHAVILRSIMHHCKSIGLFCDLVCAFFVLCTWTAICPLCVKISEFIESNIIYEWIRNKRKQQCSQQMARTYSIQFLQNYLSSSNSNYALNRHKIMLRRMQHKHSHEGSLNEEDSINVLETPTLSSPPFIAARNKQCNVDAVGGAEGVHVHTANTHMSSNSANSVVFDDNDMDTVYITKGIKRISRTCVFGLLLLISWTFRYRVVFLESIVGICFSSVTCMIIPCFLYLKSFWNTMSCWNKLTYILLLIFMLVMAVALFVGTVIHDIHGDQYYDMP